MEVRVIAGNAANNTIAGSALSEMIFARKGSDTAIGRGANDLLCGGNGNDKLTGGVGADHFGGGSGTDTATDFNADQETARAAFPRAKEDKEATTEGRDSACSLGPPIFSVLIHPSA